MSDAAAVQPEDRRHHGVRRDINALFRGKDGEISGSKIGTYVAQYIAAKILLAYTPPQTLPGWDVLAVLFLVLIAPEAYKQLMAMKWGGGAGVGAGAGVSGKPQQGT